MPKRKLSITTLNSGKGHGKNNGQSISFNHQQFVCINCKKIINGNLYRHKCQYCKQETVYVIPTYAQIPKNTASKRQWDLFIKKFIERGKYTSEFYKEKNGNKN